jgi:DNA invertase Pin-like site-specific DNA recombinase
MTQRVAIYARTSPDCLLSAEDQVQRLKTVAAERGWTVMAAFTDRPTSARGPDRRPGETTLIDAIRSGTIDRVLIWSVCRIGRSLVEMIGFLEACRTAGVGLYLHEQSLDTETCNGLSLFDLASLMALHVRQSRRDRILRGQAAARSLSIRFGRPPIPAAKVEKAKTFLAMGKGVREVARLAGGISPSSVSRIAASLRPTPAALKTVSDHQ